MITLLHGDNIDASRKELNELKSRTRGREIREIDGKHIDEAMLAQALESSSLFGGETAVIIENLFSSLGKKITLAKKFAQQIGTSSAEVILWEEKEIGKTAVDNLGPKPTVRLFKTPVIIFKFLDALKPNNTSVALSLFEQLVLTDAPELVFSMMVRRVRQLIQLADNVIPEGLQSWQAKSLTNQSRLFTIDKLLGMHQQLLNMEYSIKTGSSPFTMRQHIEQFIISS